jgi:hypothetical protein
MPRQRRQMLLRARDDHDHAHDHNFYDPQNHDDHAPADDHHTPTLHKQHHKLDYDVDDIDDVHHGVHDDHDSADDDNDRVHDHDRLDNDDHAAHDHHRAAVDVHDNPRVHHDTAATRIPHRINGFHNSHSGPGGGGPHSQAGKSRIIPPNWKI